MTNEKLLLVILRVDLDIILPFFRDIFFGEDRLHWADSRARAAIDARGGIDVKLGNTGKIALVLTRMDAIDRADLEAVAGFGIYARLCDNKWHNGPPYECLTL